MIHGHALFFYYKAQYCGMLSFSHEDFRSRSGIYVSLQSL